LFARHIERGRRFKQEEVVNPRSVLTIILTVLTISLALPVRPGAAQADDRCFSETGLCISGRIREFWERNGGLPVFGLPITEQREEVNPENSIPYQTQWFERVRFELHPENERPYDVLLGRIGDDRLRQTGRDWQSLPREAPQPGCQFFVQTGFNVCDDILQAWHANGLEFDGRRGMAQDESLALYGAPISPLTTEIVEGHPYQVQWFERARFELHLDNQPPYNVLLGRLAAETRDSALARQGPRVLFIGGNFELYRANADGSGQTRLPLTDQLRVDRQATTEVHNVSVAPDGQRIAAVVAVQSSPASPQIPSLVLTNRDGTGNARILAQGLREGDLTTPAWSPDGRQIAFVRLVSSDDRLHIFVVNADGTGSYQLTTGTTNDVGPQWSPDGKTIAFLSDPNAVNAALSGQYLLTVVPRQGGTPRGIASPAGSSFQWTPGGNELAFTEVADGRRQIVALNPETGAQRTIVREDVDLFDAALSPDGGRIAYYRCCSDYNSLLVVRDFRSGQVTEIGYGRTTPRWSPDGQFITVIEDQRVRYPSVIHRSDSNLTHVEMIGAVVGWLP
jgi:Tol biopolymer transport system component